MKISNVHGRAVLVTAANEGIDIASASNDRFGPSPAQLYNDWNAFRVWAADASGSAPHVRLDTSDLRSPSPQPRQILGVGLNYRDHAAEAGFDLPDSLPPVFVKFVSSLGSAHSTVTLPAGGNTDWEVELVVVISEEASNVPAEKAWDFVAGVTVGQDLSERISQTTGPAPQFSLGKSFPGFAPVGPWLVTTDELADRDDLALGCSVNGETMQHARTSLLLFPVTALISRITNRITLYPGDMIFTGTPSGVGMARKPQRFLQPGDVLESWIEGIGEIRQTFVATQEA